MQFSVFMVDSKTDFNRKECGIILDMTDGLQMAGEGGGDGEWWIMILSYIHEGNGSLFSDRMRYRSEQNSKLYLWLMNAKQTDFHT